MISKTVCLVLTLAIACGAIILSNETELQMPKSVQMKPVISDHPNYNTLKQFKNDNAKALMQKFGAHSLGIRWREDSTDVMNGNKDIALAVYINIDNVSERSLPEYIEIEKPGSLETLKIAIEVISSQQNSFE